jgi:regulator of RNase E activity RraA
MGHYTIAGMPVQPSAELMTRMAQVETATIGHLRHTGFMQSRIQPMSTGRHVAGCAVTLLLPAAHDSTLLHHALSLVRPGDVLVIDRQGDARYACWGGGVTNAAVKAGIAGAIIDGPCTDPAEIRERAFGLWCHGVSPLTTRVADIAGAMNVPVVCGGVPVRPGDIVLADESGVVVLNPDEAAELVETAIARQENSARRMRAVNEGARLGELSGATEMVMRGLQRGTP